MLDRESTFADAGVVEMLKTKFVPVAIDQWYTRQQEDAEGRFYQAIAKQGPHKDMDATTQGFYVCDAAGKLFAYNNNRHVGPIKKAMRGALEEIGSTAAVPAIKLGERDSKYARDLPKGAVVVRVNAKVCWARAMSKVRKSKRIAT